MLSWCAVKFGLAVIVLFFAGFRHGESTEVDLKDGFVVSPTLVTAAVFSSCPYLFVMVLVVVLVLDDCFSAGGIAKGWTGRIDLHARNDSVVSDPRR